MKITHYKMDMNNLDYTLLQKLHTDKMYTSDGVLKDVYLSPYEYFQNEAYVSVLTHRKKLLSMLYLGKEIYHDWNYHFEGLNNTYGLLSFYTKPEYRNKGYSKTLFEDFDKTFHIRRLGAVKRCKGILKSVEDTDKFFVDDGYQGA